MRFQAVALLVLLSACSGGSSQEPRLRSEPTVHTARSALLDGSPTLALKLVDVILAHDPENVDALITRGDAQFALGHSELATANYQRALRNDRSSIGARIGLGRVRLKTDPAQAEAMFVKVLGEDPRNVTALNDLGVVCDLQNRHADAQENYRRALALDPNNASAQINLGLSLAMSGDKAGALELLEPLSRSPAVEQRVQRNLAAALSSAGDPEGAARVMDAQGADATSAQMVR